jgi:hypothetical protein
MKIVRVSLFLGAALGIGLFAHVRPASASQEAADATRNGHSEASLIGGTPINAELNSSIDSKKVKAGDTVMAHTTGAVKSADDRVILPRGTKVVGHIAQASARSKGDADSAIAIGFDKAILKGGEEVPLSVTIRALAAPANGFEGGSGADSTAGTSSPSNYPNSSANGGGMNNKPPMSDAPRSYPGAGGASTEATSAGGANSSRELAPNSRGVIGLSGLRLSLAGAESAQVSIISSTGKNVHLDGGTRLLLVTETPASEAPGQ